MSESTPSPKVLIISNYTTKDAEGSYSHERLANGEAVWMGTTGRTEDTREADRFEPIIACCAAFPDVSSDSGIEVGVVHSDSRQLLNDCHVGILIYDAISVALTLIVGIFSRLER